MEKIVERIKEIAEKVKELVMKNKKVSIIVAASVVVLIIILICIFGGGNSAEGGNTIEDKIRRNVISEIKAQGALEGDLTNINPRITTLRENSNGEWEVYGKVSARDNYGDTYTGNFEGICEVQGSVNIDCDLDYDDMYKD